MFFTIAAADIVTYRWRLTEPVGGINIVNILVTLHLRHLYIFIILASVILFSAPSRRRKRRGITAASHVVEVSLDPFAICNFPSFRSPHVSPFYRHAPRSAGSVIIAQPLSWTISSATQSCSLASVVTTLKDGWTVMTEGVKLTGAIIFTRFLTSPSTSLTLPRLGFLAMRAICQTWRCSSTSFDRFPASQTSTKGHQEKKNH